MPPEAVKFLKRISNIILPFDHGADQLRLAIAARLKIPVDKLRSFKIVRKAIDARKKEKISAVYTVDVDDGSPSPQEKYISPAVRAHRGPRPVIAGGGPCGLFAGLLLAEAGMKPLMIDRGKAVHERIKDVQAFWSQGILDPESNVQFGEGGAGTFSDGKLTTQIKDKNSRIRKVLEEFVAAGAPEEILYSAKPHIGTDNLVKVVTGLSNKITKLGGEIRFETKLTGVKTKNGRIAGVILNNREEIETEVLLLALGHSARDTFEMLHQAGVRMEAKPFSIGVRIEHLQEMIDRSQYGRHAGNPVLPRADYKLVHHSGNGRSVYTFCMCPGGRVIGSSSESGMVVTNGMSVFARNGKNANSALLVGIDPRDFEGADPLAGIRFQRKWEERASRIGGGNYFAPVQTVGDFLLKRPSKTLGAVVPSYTPGFTPSDIAECLPEFVVNAIRTAIPLLDNKLKGFAAKDAVMTAVESRSSSPIRIVRDDKFQSLTLSGLFPAGEGAGYSGGIVSSAVDGIKTAEAIIGGVTS